MLWAGALSPDTYGRPTIGTTSEIKRISRQDCLDYYARSYEPNNMIIAVSGAFDAAQLTHRIHQAFPTRGNQTSIPSVEYHSSKYAAGFHGEVRLPSRGQKLYAGLPAPGLDHSDFAALEIVHHTLLEGESGRLQRHLINESESVSYTHLTLPTKA